MSNIIKTAFDGQWDFENLEAAIEICPKADIFPTINKYLTPESKILESGCGFGKWLFYFHRKGYDITGLDWSVKTIQLIKCYDPSAKAVAGDARKSDFQDNKFNLILSLGTIEHSYEGPDAALRDAYRILKPKGILIVTVPILTPIRRFIYFIKAIFRTGRVIAKRLSSNGTTSEPGLFKLRRKGVKGLYLMPVWEKNSYKFFEYRFPLKRLQEYVKQNGFEPLECFPFGKKDGVFHDLIPFSGTWDYRNGHPILSVLAKIAYALFPFLFWHMACCVARKKDQ